RGRRRLRLRHGREARRAQGQGRPATGMGAAEGQVRDRSGQGEPEPGRSAGIRPEGAGEERSCRSRRRRFRAAEEAVRRAFPVVLVLATALSVTFLLLPVLAIFLRVSPGHLLAQLGSPVARDALPLALGGLGAGAALSFARALGEFGATIMFAGSLRGVTQTLPLAIYAEFDLIFEVALAMGALLVLVSGTVLLASKMLPRWL